MINFVRGNKKTPDWAFNFCGGWGGIPSALCACGQTVTIWLYYVCQIYLFSNPATFVAMSNPMPYTTKIKCPNGHLIFVADGEGFEPPDELPRQRFSRPSHSTALPPILNFSQLILTLFFTKRKYIFWF